MWKALPFAIGLRFGHVCVYVNNAYSFRTSSAPPQSYSGLERSGVKEQAALRWDWMCL